MQLFEKITTLINALTDEQVRQVCSTYSPIEIGFDEAAMDFEELIAEIVHVMTFQNPDVKPNMIVHLALDFATVTDL